MPPPVKAPTKGAGAKASNPKASNGHKPNGRPAIVKPRNAKPEKHPIADQWLIVTIPVERIEASPYQPRLSFDADEMNDLVASVRAKGVQQPIIVRTRKDDVYTGAGINGTGHAANGTTHGKGDHALKGAKNGVSQSNAKPELVRYELIAGERRLRASKEGGRKSIPAIVRDDLTDAECAELALLENVQRSNLSVIEEARGYKRLMLQFRMKEERIAKKVGKSVATIREMMKLLQLPEAVQKLLSERKLTASHGHELLQLVPFERLCLLVAAKVVKDHLTAQSLQAAPLPNVSELKRLGLVAELDWRTKFDWKNECGKCPHKAYVTSNFGCYCLKPDEWNKKQAAAIERQKQESAQIMEEARQQNGQPVEAEKLPPSSYRNLSLGNVPAGCSDACPCRSQATDSQDPTRKYPVCLDPNRWSELAKAERKAHEEARQKQYLALWEEAKEVLKVDVEAKASSRLVALIALPILQAQFCRYMDEEQKISLFRGVGQSLGLYVPWDELCDEEKEARELYALLHRQLETQAPERLLLLCACLLLAYEANQVVQFSGETPGLDFVLGRKLAEQRELEEEIERSDPQED